MSSEPTLGAAEIEQRFDALNTHLTWVADELADLENKVMNMEGTIPALQELKRLREWLRQQGRGPDLRPILARLQALEQELGTLRSCRAEVGIGQGREPLRRQVEGLEAKVEVLTALLQGESGWGAIIDRLNEHEETMVGMIELTTLRSGVS